MEIIKNYDFDHSEQPNTETISLVNMDHLQRGDGAPDEISFSAVDDKSLNEGSSPYSENEALRDNAARCAERSGYFLRKGFSDAIKNADESVVTPIYIDNEGKRIKETLTKDEALEKISEGKLSIKGFKYNKDAPAEQRAKAFENILRTFVATSNNHDFATGNVIFRACTGGCEKDFKTCAYNNKNPEKEMEAGEVMHELGIFDATYEAKRLRILRQKIEEQRKQDQGLVRPQDPKRDLPRDKEPAPKKNPKNPNLIALLQQRRNDYDPRFKK